MKAEKVLMTIGGIMVGVFVMGLFSIGPALIESLFDAQSGPWRVFGIIYIAVGAIGLILLIIAFILSVPHSSSKTTSSSSNPKTDNSDYTEPVTPSSFYEYGTMTDEYGQKTDVTHNTITDIYTDAAGHTYTKDGDKFYTDD